MVKHFVFVAAAYFLNSCGGQSHSTPSSNSNVSRFWKTDVISPSVSAQLSGVEDGSKSGQSGERAELFYSQVYNRPYFSGVPDYVYHKRSPSGVHLSENDFLVQNEVESFVFSDVKFEVARVIIGHCEVHLNYSDVQMRVGHFEPGSKILKFKLKNKSAEAFEIPYVVTNASFRFSAGAAQNSWIEQDRAANLKLISEQIDRQTNPAILENVFDFLDSDSGVVVDEKVALWLESRRRLLFRKTSEHLRRMLKSKDIFERYFREVLKYFPALPIYGKFASDLILEYSEFPRTDPISQDDKVVSVWQVRSIRSPREFPSGPGKPLSNADSILAAETNPAENRAILVMDTAAMTTIGREYLETFGASRLHPTKLEDGTIAWDRSIVLPVPNRVLRDSLGKLDRGFADLLQDGPKYVALIFAKYSKISFRLPHLNEGNVEKNYLVLNLRINLHLSTELYSLPGPGAEFAFTYRLEPDGTIISGDQIGLVKPSDVGAEIADGAVTTGFEMNEALKFIVVKTLIDSNPFALEAAKFEKDAAGNWVGTALTSFRGSGVNPNSVSNRVSEWNFITLVFRLGLLAEPQIEPVDHLDHRRDVVPNLFNN